MPTSESLNDLLDRERIASVINQLFVSTDARRWGAVQAAFTKSVLFDMTSMAGGTPQQLPPSEIVAAWQASLAPLEAVHHQTGNLEIDLRGDEADAVCYGTAYHYRKTRFGRNTRTFVGSYDVHLRKAAGAWRIDRFRFNLKFIDGNVNLEKEPGGP